MLYYSWRPSHWCINYYCKTDIGKARVNSELRHNSKYMSKFNFDLFKRKIIFLGFPCCSTHEDLPIDVAINYYCSLVGLILTELGWFQHFGTSQNTHQIQFWLFRKENQIFGFPCSSTHEDLPIDLSITRDVPDSDFAG